MWTMFCLSAWVVPAISAGHGSGAVRDQEKIGGCLGVPVQDFLPWAKPQCEMGIHSSVLIALFKKVVKRKDPVARKYVGPSHLCAACSQLARHRDAGSTSAQCKVTYHLRPRWSQMTTWPFFSVKAESSGLQVPSAALVIDIYSANTV